MGVFDGILGGVIGIGATALLNSFIEQKGGGRVSTPPTGGHNRVLNNEAVGAGPYPIPSTTTGFGIFVGEPGFPSNNNLIQENNASGNPGTGIFISAGSVGNTDS
jgi:hypothetical protein